jgi:glutamate-ammonia-ligase adenylyltransferase
LIDPGFLTEIPSRAELESRFAAELARVSGYEAALDVARRFAKEESFRIGVQIIQGMGDAEQAGPAYAAVAETVIAGLQGTVESEMVALHGRVPGGAFAVVAQGKLGGREMTAASDLDLVFVYAHASDAVLSDGAKPLSPSVYFARLAQRFISALTAMTAEGRLYEVDMRLRPSGNQGPVAVRFDTFLDYHRERSWTWERMALTRARVLSGPFELSRDVEAAIRASLTQRSDPKAIFEDARAMREKLAAQFPGSDIWDIKFAPGGLVDIEFIAQVLQLREASRNPDTLDQNTISALEKLMQAGALGVADGQALISAAWLEHGLTQVLRIAAEGRRIHGQVPRHGRDLRVRAVGRAPGCLAGVPDAARRRTAPCRDQTAGHALVGDVERHEDGQLPRESSPAIREVRADRAHRPEEDVRHGGMLASRRRDSGDRDGAR